VEFNDKVFLNEINEAIIETHKAFSTMNFRNGLKSGYYDLQTNRNFYRASVSNGLNKNVLRRYMEVSILLLSPICPHWSQAMWELIGNQGLVLHQKWPIADPVDKQLIAISKYIQDFSHELRLGFLSFLKSKGGKGKKGSDSGSARSVSLPCRPLKSDCFSLRYFTYMWLRGSLIGKQAFCALLATL